MDAAIIDFLQTPWSYWTFAFACASFVTGAFIFIENRILPDSSKASLALWLMGTSENTWAKQFGGFFDGVFGKKHFSLRRIVTSALFSVVSVLVLYVMFTHILGITTVRVDDGMAVEDVLVLGLIINILPDYLSLIETRWLLKRFERVRSFSGQLAVLALDFAFSGAIIWAVINAVRLANGDAYLSPFEMMLAFSMYAVFFYSTFATSVWAWLYCVSTWMVRFFSSKASTILMNVEHKPLTQVGFAAGVLVFTVFTLKALVPDSTDTSPITSLDRFICSHLSPELCKHVTRLSPQDRKDLAIITRACEGGGIDSCQTAAFRHFKGNKAKAAALWQKACDGGDMGGCTNLGVFYDKGQGVARNAAKAAEILRLACDGGNIWGCINLGVLYLNGEGVVQNATEAARLYEQACDGGNMWGCASLGHLYGTGQGVDQDVVKAAGLLRQACDGGTMQGCALLGLFYEEGQGVARDAAQAARFYRQACNGGLEPACGYLKALGTN